MKIDTKAFACAAVASALGAMLLAVGFYVQVLEFLWYFLAAMMLNIPLGRGYIKAAFFSYLAACMLALLLCSFQLYFILPYALFMGPHLIVNRVLSDKRFVAWAGHLIKAVWFNASVFAFVLFTQLFLFVDLSADGTAAVVAAVSTVVYFPYDFGIRYVSRRIESRFAR